MPRQTKGKTIYIVMLLLVILFVASFIAGRLGMFQTGSMSLSSNKISFSSEKVAVIYINGVLDDATGFLRELGKYNDMEDVKAIVIRIESPGGTIVPAQEIYEEIRKLRGKKIVIASLGNIAASGGYYVASATEEIVANPGSLTGSIGVISVFRNYQDLMEKVGYKMKVMKSGRYKDLGNPTREMSNEEVLFEQQLLENIHAQFIRDVARGRNRDVEEIKPYADGRTFTGEQAKEIGLVDRLGNLQDTIDRAAELSGIEGQPVVLYPEERRISIWEFVLQGVFSWFQIELHDTLEQFNTMSHYSSPVPSILGRK